MDDTKFREWMRKVNAQVIALCGLSADDLPDVCYRDWFEDGVSALAAAKRAVRYAREG